MEIQDIKNKYGITVKDLVSLRKNVMFVVDEKDEERILKIKRVSVKKNWEDSHRFYNELRMYKSFSAASLQFLRVPELYSYSKDSMIMECVKKKQGERIVDKEFIDSYIELQLLKVPRKFFFDLKNQFIRGFFYQAILVSVFTISRKINILTSLKIISLYLKLDLFTNKLKSRYWLHGDLNFGNVYYNIKNNQLYFIDFENMFYTRKWILVEVIFKCLSYQGEENLIFNMNYLNIYLNQFGSAIKEDGNSLNIKKQVRFSVLIKCVHSIAMTKDAGKKKAYLKLLETCLSNKGFEKWYLEKVKGER